MGIIINDLDTPNTFQSKRVKSNQKVHKPFFVKQLEKRSKAK